MSAAMGTARHELNMSRDVTHECEGVKQDGEKCTKRAKEHFGPPYGWRCGVHSAIGFLRQQQLRDYEAFQKASFGGLVRSWTDAKLQERERATRPGTIQDGMTDERAATVRAEHFAVETEIKRRNRA